ncbi:MAG: alpha/beta fold hydrolase [Actinomycetota bacterium]|nr:alpha/beta fold hydrolase [Actinomycetota bacterium]MDQ2955342.1 alpha/beta fold hydrolase [Actinomycetota bacterium]
MPTPRQVTSRDGTRIATYTDGQPSAPTIVAIHGYPDNAAVWDAVVTELAPSYHLIRYDVRGTGASDKPAARRAYLLDQLQDDFIAVIDALSPDRPVHVLAHDWGSVQAWHWVNDPRMSKRIVSYTSISGPCLEQIGPWLQASLRNQGYRKVLRQLLDSYYIAIFKLPWLPELLWRSGLLDAALGRSEGRTHRPATGSYRRSWADKANGLQLYRANLLTWRRSAGPRRRETEIPVQVLAPLSDPFVSAAVQLEAPRPFVPNFHPRTVRGGHWVVTSRPAVIAQAVTELIELVDSGRAGMQLASHLD